MRVSIFYGRTLMFTSRDRNRMNIDDGPQSARQKKSRCPRTGGRTRPQTGMHCFGSVPADAGGQCSPDLPEKGVRRHLGPREFRATIPIPAGDWTSVRNPAAVRRLLQSPESPTCFTMQRTTDGQQISGKCKILLNSQTNSKACSGRRGRAPDKGAEPKFFIRQVSK